MTTIIDGKQIAENLKNCLKQKVKSLIEQTKKTPCLAVCLVGDDIASKIYVASKEKAAADLGIKSIVHILPSSTKQSDLQNLLANLSKNPEVNGILLQLPLPEGLNTDAALLQIDPLKDVDGLHPFNLGMILTGQPSLIPCTPFGIIRALKSLQINLKGLRGIVLGRSRLVGKPIAELLLNEDITVTIAHSKTPKNELIQIIKQSDLVIAAIGKPQFVQADWLKEGAIVIDVGINRLENKKLVGDVDYQAALPKVKAITPVPGGIGPLTVSHLLLNTIKAFELQNFGYSSIEL